MSFLDRFPGATRLFASCVLLVSLAGCSTTEPPQETRRAEPLPPPIAGAPYPGASPYSFPSNPPSTHATSAIMIDARTGQTLFYKNPDQIRAVASTQKLLTALLIVERGGLSQSVTVASSDTRVEPSKLGFRPGERYSRNDLLTTLMVKSCNDAAKCLARDYAGSSERFAAVMNRRARELGAKNSNFVNPHGLTVPGQYSTARDIARIAFRAYRSRTLRRKMLIKRYTFRFNSGRTKTLVATNKLLSRSSIFTGMKTGYTSASGRCLVTSASYGGRDVILVQLGSKTKYIFDDADRITRWGLAR